MAELIKAELRLWIYGGTVQDSPNNPNYILTKHKLSGEETIVFEISELIKDYVDIKFNGDYDSLEQTKWVKWRIERTYRDENDVETKDHYSEHGLAFRGFGGINDGINPELSKDLMISNSVVHNLCGQKTTVPFYTREDGVTKVRYFDNSSETGSIITGSAEEYTISQSTIINTSENVITIDKTHTVFSDSDSSSDSSELPIGTDEIKYTTANGEEKSILVKCIDECKNIPHKISFINKFGVMQDIWFFAKRKDSISSDREKYKKNILDIGSNGASYNESSHQNVYLENQGRELITMNTGFIDESYGEVMKELIVSEFVYISHRFKRSPTNPAYPLAIPITVNTNSLDMKTQRDDKLINYELQFEMDSEFIQSVR